MNRPALLKGKGLPSATAMLYTDLNADAIGIEANGCGVMDAKKDLVFDGRAEE